MIVAPLESGFYLHTLVCVRQQGPELPVHSLAEAIELGRMSQSIAVKGSLLHSFKSGYKRPSLC